MTRRLALLSATFLALGASGASVAQATPIAPGATPLWMQAETAGLPAGCAQAGDLDGTRVIAAVKRVATRRRAEVILGAALLDGLVGKPTVFACDPALAQRRALPGPITGDSALAMQDRLFYGERALVGSATEGPAGLRSGDRLTFPPLGPTASVDLTVAAGDATTTLRLPPSTDQPAAARIVGTPSAPSVLVTRSSGSEQAVAVPVPPAGKHRVRWSRRGDRVTARVTGNAGVLTALLPNDGEASDAAVLGTGGAAGLSLRVPRTRTSLLLIAYDPRTRAVWINTCSTRRGKPVRCGTERTKLDSLVDAILGPDFLRLSAARAVRAAVGAAHTRMPTVRRAPRPRRPFATAAATSRRATAAATVTRIDRERDAFFTLAPGDLNGDGLPDGVTSTDLSAGALRVSSGNGRWQSVRVKGSANATVDLDGDGRAELVTEREDVLVTDAFAQGATPRVIDLSRQREPRARDLVLGTSELALTIDEGVPDAALPDVTGDGRPELALTDGLVVVLPSEAFPYGRAANRAEVLPSSFASADNLDEFLADEDDPALERQNAITAFATAGRVFTVAPRDRALDGTAPRTIDLDERAARDGAVITRRTFTTSGWPKISDLDARSGDVLIVLEAAKGCERPFELDLPIPGLGGNPQSGPSCKQQVLRIDASGKVVATITATASRDQPVDAVFAPDGADADSQLEVLVALEGYLNPGELRLAPSSTVGTVRLSRLPRVALGRSDGLVGDLSAVVLPNGSRWNAVATARASRDGRRARPSEFLLVQPK